MKLSNLVHLKVEDKNLPKVIGSTLRACQEEMNGLTLLDINLNQKSHIQDLDPLIQLNELTGPNKLW